MDSNHSKNKIHRTDSRLAAYGTRFTPKIF